MVWRLVLVIINDFDLMDIARFPDKADAPLVVNPNTVLPSPSALERFEPVGRRHPRRSFRLSAL